MERSKRRAETARRKLAAVHHWSITLERAADDFRRSHMQFASWIDIDVSRAVATLNKMSEALVTYISMKRADDALPEEAEEPAQTPAAVSEGDAPAREEKSTE